jgi:hypothetical protein
MRITTHLSLLGWVFALAIVTPGAHADMTAEADAGGAGVPTATPSTAVGTGETAPAVLPAPESELPKTANVTIRVEANTYVLVRQENNLEELFKGSLSAGQSVTVERNGIIRVVSPNIQNVTVEIGEERFKSNQTGLRQTYYGMDGPIDVPASATPAVPTPSVPDPAQNGPVTILATANAYVLVRQENNLEELFKGSLSAGQSITVERNGIIRVVSPEIQNVTVEIGGERFKSNQTGLRQTYYGMTGPIAPPQSR